MEQVEILVQDKDSCWQVSRIYWKQPTWEARLDTGLLLLTLIEPRDFCFHHSFIKTLKASKIFTGKRCMRLNSHNYHTLKLNITAGVPDSIALVNS